MSTFETKDSGQRAEYDSGMVRDIEEGKPRFDLLLPLGVPYEEQMLTRDALLMERGQKKYGARNWEKANGEAELARYRSSAFRHLMQWIAGETDEDHAAAVRFNIMAGEYVKGKLMPSGEPLKEAFRATVEDMEIELRRAVMERAKNEFRRADNFDRLAEAANAGNPCCGFTEGHDLGCPQWR